jgi:Arc/MetJ-type ribon-helix-helix transcriptional regulator
MAAPETLSTDPFDYAAAAELFTMRGRKGSRPMGYRRFTNAADAIRFAIEELQPETLKGAQLEVEEQRFDCDGMRRLYDASEYPLARRAEGQPLNENGPSFDASGEDRGFETEH